MIPIVLKHNKTTHNSHNLLDYVARSRFLNSRCIRESINLSIYMHKNNMRYSIKIYTNLITFVKNRVVSRAVYCLNFHYNMHWNRKFNFNVISKEKIPINLLCSQFIFAIEKREFTLHKFLSYNNISPWCFRREIFTRELNFPLKFLII